MKLFKRLQSVASFKGFSPAIFIVLLVCVASTITLMLAAVAGVGILGAFNHIVGTYHSQTIKSSDAFVISDIERLVKSTVQHVQNEWEKLPLSQSDFSQARHNLAAWHWDPSTRTLRLVSDAGAATMDLREVALPFKAVVEMKLAIAPSGESISLPRLPSRIKWQISRQSTENDSAWLIWGIDEDATYGIWGFRLRQNDLRPALVKLLRRLCHDNHMQVALLDQAGRIFIAADYKGEISNISSLTPQKNQDFFARELGSTGSGLTMQVVFTPGILGQLPDWAPRAMLVFIALVGSLLASSLVYFYGMERQSTSRLRLQNDWVLNLSHSLRGPCHSLGVLLEAIRSNKAGDNEELFLLSNREIEAMDTHCRRFLQLARREAGSSTLALSSVSLTECLGVATDRVWLRYPQVDRSCLEIMPMTGIEVIANRMSAEEVFITLIDNAIKYSIHQKNIRISGNARDGVFDLQIRDSGTGISSEELSRIGQPFFRSSRPELEGVSGTGVGLYLARETCIAMGWQLRITSEGCDKGTLVTLTMPMEKK